jgi:hypothetical protein
MYNKCEKLALVCESSEGVESYDGIRKISLWKYTKFLDGRFS